MIHLVQHYFEASADRFPDKIAIGYRDESITFKNLDEFTNGLARHLIDIGAKRGSLVPLFMQKNINAFKSMLGVLKADCAYVPLDRKSPGSRLISIFERCEAGIVLVDNESEAELRQIVDDAGAAVTLVNVETAPTHGYESPPVRQHLYRHGLRDLHIRLHRRAEGRDDSPLRDRRLHRLLCGPVRTHRRRRGFSARAVVFRQLGARYLLRVQRRRDAAPGAR